jgi:SAM-dependent methyltransferase
MAYLDFMSAVHKSTTRDYLARVNDSDFPKHKAAGLAKEWGYDYWDGDRRINYGGYRYLENRWEKVAHAMQEHYQLPKNAKILDVGCGKGFMLYDFTKVLPDAEVHGIDISAYAIEIVEGRAESLPWPDNYFDFVYSLNTFHNLYAYQLEPALFEFERVGKHHKYLCVESYRNEQEKANLLYWQVTCEAFNTPQEWEWWFKQTGYTGDHSLIFFE